MHIAGGAFDSTQTRGTPGQDINTKDTTAGSIICVGSALLFFSAGHIALSPRCVIVPVSLMNGICIVKNVSKDESTSVLEVAPGLSNMTCVGLISPNVEEGMFRPAYPWQIYPSNPSGHPLLGETITNVSGHP